MDNIQKAFKTKSKLRGMAAPKQELSDGGKVKGKGGPTDDKVGPVALSDGEYVLPADTVEIVGRDNLDALRLATHDFVDDNNKPNVSGLRKMANGGTFYVNPEGAASRQMPPGRAVVPYQPPAAPAVAASAPPASAPPASAPPAAPASRLGAATRLAGNVVAPAVAAYNAFTDSPEARKRAASGQEGAAGVASQVGSYLGSALSFGTSSPQDIGSVTSALRGEGTGAYHAVPDAEKGWARRQGERFLPTESAKIMSDQIQLSDGAQSQADLLSRNGIDLSNMSEDDYARAREIMGTPQSRTAEFPGMSDVPADVRTSSAGMPATPVQPQSYQSRRLAEMGVPVDQQNLAPVTEDTRRSLLREGGGTPGQYVNLGSYGGDANIYGTASESGGRINSFVGVGAGALPGSENRGNTIPSSALRGGAAPTTAGQSGQRGGGSRVTVVGPSSNGIDRRYDEMAKQLRGMYSEKGQGNLAKRLLQLEEQRMNAHNAAAGNETTLRGQDIEAETSRSNAALRAETSIATAMEEAARGRATAATQTEEARLKAQQAAADAQRKAGEAGVKDLDNYVESAFADNPQEADRFRTYVQSAGPELVGELTTLHGGDRRRAFEDMRQRMLIQDRGGEGNTFTGAQSSGYDPVANVNLDPGVSDILNAYWNGGMGGLDTSAAMLKEFSPFDNALTTFDSGQVRPASRLRGGDMRSTRAIEDMVGDRPRREALRRLATDN